VTGQGTCANGANVCATGATCNVNCLCIQSTTNETRCADIVFPGCSGVCQSDADCAERHPDFPGAFCGQSMEPCMCGASNVCVLPCPN
jgi:hypothetical protein